MTCELPYEDIGQAWGAARGPAKLLHADTAACGRTSRAARARIAEHLDLEADLGAYTAEIENGAELHEARVLLGQLLGFSAEDLAFVESASAALAQLLDSWPLQTGDQVWVVPSEWGPNLAAFHDRGLRVEFLDVEKNGQVDLESLRRRLTTERPALVHLTAVAAHRALVQPIAETAAVCEPHEVPVMVDAAQAVGHIELTAGAAAVYGTGRKYLGGPRGVGYLGVRDPWQARLIPRAPAIIASLWPGEDRPVRRLASREAFIAGRLGLGVALREYHDLGPEPIRHRLRAIGVALRSELADIPGWRLRDPIDAPGAIVSLEPADDDLDVAGVRAELLRQGVLSTVCGAHRAPHEITAPLLRFSPHIDITMDGIRDLAARLTDVRRAASPPPR